MEATRSIRLTVNGTVYERMVAVRMTLADFLREELNLTGTERITLTSGADGKLPMPGNSTMGARPAGGGGN